MLTSLANPKLSVFFVALFPQFVPDGAPVLPLTMAKGAPGLSRRGRLYRRAALKR